MNTVIMKQIIKIRKSPTTGNPVVDARELYNFLEINKEFSNWIKEKLNPTLTIKDK